MKLVEEHLHLTGCLAQSMIEYVHHNTKAKTLFSTHYHELTHLDETLSDLKYTCSHKSTKVN